MTLPGAAALLLVAALAADEGRPQRVLVVAPRAPASPTLADLTRAVSSQLARSGKRVVVPDSALRKALEETKSPPLTDLDDPAQIALALQLVGADYLVSVISARTLIVRSVGVGMPSGRLVATAGGEPADVAMDLVRQLERPVESPSIAPPPPLPRIGERVLLELRVTGGGEVAGSATFGEYAVSVGFEAPFESRWSVGGSVGLKLGSAWLDFCDVDAAVSCLPIFSMRSNFRLPIALDLRWAFLKGGNWIAQAAIGAEASYVGFESSDSFALTIGPSAAVQLGYSLSERFQVRLGARYVAAFFVSNPETGVTIGDPLHKPDLSPLDPVHHQVQGFVAIDLSL